MTKFLIVLSIVAAISGCTSQSPYGEYTTRSMPSRTQLIRSGDWVTNRMRNELFEPSNYSTSVGFIYYCQLAYGTSEFPKFSITTRPNGKTETQLSYNAGLGYLGRNGPFTVRFGNVPIDLGISNFDWEGVSKLTSPKKGYLDALARDLSRPETGYVEVMDFESRVVARYPATGFGKALDKLLECRNSL